MDDKAEAFDFFVLFEDCFPNVGMDWFWVLGVKDGVVGFGRVWDEVVVVEVGDETAEFGLCELL